MRQVLWLLVGLAIGCGSDADMPSSCDANDRDGTYELQFTTQSGDCGDIPSFIGRLDADAPLGPGCELTAADDVSGDGCRLDRSLRCTESNGRVTETVGYTEDTSGDGSRMEGSMTFHITLADGTECVGTYDVVATRQ